MHPTIGQILHAFEASDVPHAFIVSAVRDGDIVNGQLLTPEGVGLPRTNVAPYDDATKRGWKWLPQAPATKKESAPKA